MGIAVKSKIIAFATTISIIAALLTGLYINAIFGPSPAIRISPFWFSAGMFFLVFMLSLAFAYRLFRPIDQMIIATQLLSQGQYGHEINNSSGDEFGRLASSFNEMSRKLKYTMQEKVHFSDIVAQERCKNDHILDSMAEGVIVNDKNYKIVLFNRAARELFGISGKKVASKHIIHFFRRSGLEKAISKFPSYDEDMLPIRKSVPTIIEAEVEKPRKMILRLTVAPVLNEGRFPTGNVTVIEDITRSKEIDRMKNEFISTVSHELRTPLTSILGYVSLLCTGKMGELTSAQQKAIETVDKESKRLAALIEDILDLSRLESGKSQIKSDEVDLVEALNRTPVLEFAKKKNITLDIIAPASLPKINADRIKITQVFTNILSNAIKFTNPGGRIMVKFTSKKDFLQVDVKDDGVGIEKENIPKLFNRFYQVQSHLTRTQGGTGLGLSIVKEIIGAHQGLLAISSSYGKGTTVSFALPKNPVRAEHEELQCWSHKNCEKTRCPAYKNEDCRCWLELGTFCKKGKNDPCYDKIGVCSFCDVYKSRF